MDTSARNFLNLSGPEIGGSDVKNSAVLIPVGQIVQHGPHLPVGTDVFQAEGVTQLIASELARHGLPVIVGATISFGNSFAQECFPGYLNVRPEALTDQIEDIASCLSRQGFRRQAYVLFGPSSWWPLYIASVRLARLGVANMIIVDGLQTARAVSGDLLQGVDLRSGKFDVHAGELETSLMLALKPALVNMQKAVRHYSEFHPKFVDSACTRGPLLQQMAAIGLHDWSQFGEDGVTGDATLATADKGAKIVARVVDEMARHFQTYLFGKGGE